MKTRAGKLFGQTVLALCWLIGIPLAAQIPGLETNQLVVRSYPLNPYVRVLDGQWLGITAASDGNCYFGSSTHDYHHGAAFFRYSPATGNLTLLAEDLTRICGENPTNTPPQGKLHSDIVEANGWLYFSTHLGNYWPEAEAAFTGGHVIGYEMGSGRFRDFGVVRHNYTCYSAVGVDRVRNKILSFVTRYWGTPADSHLYRIDIHSGEKQDLGVVPGDTCFWFFVDYRGDCWLSIYGDNGSVRCIRSATGAVEVWKNVLPEPSLGANRWWDWAKALPGNSNCVFKLQYGNYLYRFNPDALQTNGANAFVTLRNIGPAESGLALGNDRVYYIQRPNRQSGNQGYTDFHVMSAPLNASLPILDHGLVMDQVGRLIWRVPGMSTDPLGRLFMIGDWWLLPGEQGTSVGTLRHEDAYQSTNYTALPRGEFFADIDIAHSPSQSERRDLLATTDGGGVISCDAPTTIFQGNAVVTLSAAPSPGWTFMGWSGDLAGSTSPTNLVMTRSKVIQAVFGTALHTSAIGGEIEEDPSAAFHPYGTRVRLTAIPDSGRYFTSWTGNASGSTNPLDWTVLHSPANITANFALSPPNRLSFTPSVAGHGTVTVDPAAPYYSIGQVITLTATPGPGQQFLGWGTTAGPTNNPLALLLKESGQLTANFTARPILGIHTFGGSGQSVTFTGDLNHSYWLETSTNLTNWSPLAFWTNTFGTVHFTDPTAPGSPWKFYRAK